MEEKKNYMDWWDSLPEQEKQVFYPVIADYIKKLQKEELINYIPDQEKRIIAQGILLISQVSEPELEKEKYNQSFLSIYDLLIKSRDQNEIDDNLISIYGRNLRNTKNWLHLKRGKLVKKLLGKKFSNYQYLKQRQKDNAAKILASAIELACESDQELYRSLCRNIERIQTSNSLFIGRLSNDLLQAKLEKIDLLEYIAFLIHNPKHQLISYEQLDEQWEAFPLKWCAHRMSSPEMKALFHRFKNGEDLSEVFIKKYRDDDFDTIQQLLKSTYLLLPNINILRDRINTIEEIIKCYRQQMYAASICTALSVIEGILWDFSYYLNGRCINLYKDKSHSTAINKSGKDIKKATIGYLLQQTAFGDLFDEYFVKYFCDELYSERNPIMHGMHRSYCSVENASKKLATIEYLLDAINEYIQKEYMEALDKNVPDNVKVEILSKIKNYEKLK